LTSRHPVGILLFTKLNYDSIIKKDHGAVPESTIGTRSKFHWTLLSCVKSGPRRVARTGAAERAFNVKVGDFNVKARATSSSPGERKSGIYLA
jgi:hypothetical protein